MQALLLTVIFIITYRIIEVIVLEYDVNKNMHE
jgi:hypothetical protein